MGTIIVKAYEKTIYDKTLPDKVCFARGKEMEKQDNEFQKKLEERRSESQTTT